MATTLTRVRAHQIRPHDLLVLPERVVHVRRWWAEDPFLDSFVPDHVVLVVGDDEMQRLGAFDVVAVQRGSLDNCVDCHAWRRADARRREAVALATSNVRANVRTSSRGGFRRFWRSLRVRLR